MKDISVLNKTRRCFLVILDSLTPAGPQNDEGDLNGCIHILH